MKSRDYVIKISPIVHDGMEFKIEAKGKKLARKKAVAYINKNLNGGYAIVDIREVVCSCGCSSCEKHPRNPFTYEEIKK